MFTAPKNRHSKWSLYWVSSDGYEDCFIVARNSRSAARVDRDYCGFNTNDLTALRVLAIPSSTISRWERRRKRDESSFGLPWYADSWLLRQLGATLRERESISETLIDDVVYTSGNDQSVLPRTIGKKYLRELNAVKSFRRYGHEDRYSRSQVALLTLLGICLARCQEIEYLIAHSFVLASMSPTERRRNRSIANSVRAWKKKTLGQMIQLIEEGYEIEPTVHAGLRQFLRMRNQLVHGLTTSEQYDLNTSWGQDEMIAFLSFFELISRPVREAFEASLYVSIDAGNEYLLTDKSDTKIPLTKAQRKKMSIFATFFKPRPEGEDSPE